MGTPRQNQIPGTRPTHWDPIQTLPILQAFGTCGKFHILQAFGTWGNLTFYRPSGLGGNFTFYRPSGLGEISLSTGLRDSASSAGPSGLGQLPTWWSLQVPALGPSQLPVFGSSLTFGAPCHSQLAVFGSPRLWEPPTIRNHSQLAVFPRSPSFGVPNHPQLPVFPGSPSLRAPSDSQLPVFPGSKRSPHFGLEKVLQAF